MPVKKSAKPLNTVPVAELSTIKMTTGGEKKHPVVIHNGYVKRWVGMGWVSEDKATAADIKKYPTVVV